MKVCVTSQGEDLSAAVDPRFGRARWFLLVDSETGEFEVIDNKQNLNAASGAGVQAGTNVVEAGADVVLTGHVGPRGFAVLNAADVEVFVGAEGTVQDAVDAWREGKLEQASGADVPSHW